MNKGYPHIHFNAGLGNQLFQFSYAHLLLGQHKKVTFSYDKFHRPDRPFELFELVNFCSHIDEEREVPLRQLMKWKAINRLVKAGTQLGLVDSNRASYLGIETNPFADRIEKPENRFSRYRVGYFQHWRLVEKAWNHFGEELLDFLDSSVSLPDDFSKSANFILMHVRRGDLVNQTATMGVLSSDYYRSALSVFGSGLIPELVLVTDDVTGSDPIIREFGIKRILGPSHLTPWQTLKLMSISQNFVMANSTLSWWGGFLSSKRFERNTCIAPHPWLKNWHQPVREAFLYPRFDIVQSEFEPNLKFRTDFRYTS